MPANGNRRIGLAVALLAALGFSTSGPVVKPLLEAGWSPGGAMLVRLGIGSVLLLVPALRAAPPRALNLSPSSCPASKLARHGAKNPIRLNGGAGRSAIAAKVSTPGPVTRPAAASPVTGTPPR